MKILCVAIVAIFAAYSAADAGTVELTNEKFSVDNTSVLILSATSADKNCAMEILVCGNPHGLMADQPGLNSNIKDSISNLIVSHGGQVQFTNEGRISVNDVPAYLIQYTITRGAAPPILARAYQLAANEKLYLISTRTVDPAGDADLAAIANSVRFAAPPELPTPPVSHRRLKIALAAGAGVAVVIALVVVVVVLRRKQDD